MLKVFLWLTEDEKQTLPSLAMCSSRAAQDVHVPVVKPTEVLWRAVVWDIESWSNNKVEYGVVVSVSAFLACHQC